MSAVLNRGKPRKEIMKLSLVDYTFKDEKVVRETDAVCFCEKHDDFTPIMFKSDTGPAWKGDKVTRWLTVEGVPMVHTVDTEDVVVLVSLETYLETIWGEKGYGGLPQPLRDKLGENPGISVSIAPIEPDGETQKILDKVKAKSLLYDQDLENTANLGKSEPPQSWSQSLMNYLPWIGFGVGLCYALQGIGILSGIS